MSKKVDERVVEMRFDNKDFESNVKTTMSTLDKLKAALKFPASSKALNGLGDAAKNSTSNISGIGSAVETINARFSALQVVGMTALSNITSAAMRAGTNMVKSLTLDPVIGGFQEYETQLNAVQTILSNTKSKGSTIEDVTAALDELNEYADLTIYNFTEMTRNIGTFTAAGVGLKESVSAIKGIANLAAASGSSSTQASTAMYQLSQALAAGRISLMDWNSVVNAGMGGELFQNALIRTARVMGTGVDEALEKYGTFRESLTKGQWLTAEVLTETLSQIAGAYDETALKSQGYTDQQIKEILDLADTATKAATEIKTFSQLMGTVGEAIGSGWAKTWQLVFGDFEEAKTFWTNIWNSTISPMIENMSDARNSIIEGAMGGGGSRWSEFAAELEKAGVSVETFQSKLAEVYSASSGGGSLDQLIADYGSLEAAMASGKITGDMVNQTLNQLSSSTDDLSGSTKALAEWQKVVDDVWYGTYGNIDTGRVEKLAAAGWEYAEVQKLVNMTVDGHRLTLEDLSAAQIESLGYTKEQAEALANLAKEASNAGGDFNTLINDILSPKKSGRELFLESLENILQAVIRPLGAVANAFNDVFAMDSSQLYDLIAGFNKLTKSLVMSEEDAESLRKVFKGLFSVIHLVATAAGKTFKFAFDAANAILSQFDTNVLEIAGNVGEAIYQFDQWVTSGTLIEDVLKGTIDLLSQASGPIANFFAGFKDLPAVSSGLSAVKGAFDGIVKYFESFKGLSFTDVIKKLVTDVKNAFSKLQSLRWEDVLNGLSSFGEKVREFFSDVVDDMKEVGPDILEGLQNGLIDGFDGVVEFMRELATNIVEAVKALLGIHSPSTVFFEIGKNIVEGLCNGITYMSGQISATIRTIVEDIKSAISGVDWGAVFTVGTAVGSFIVLYQLTDALQTFATGIKSFSAPFQSAANVMNTVDGFLKKLTDQNTSSKGFKNFADGVKVLAEAIAILVGSVAVLTLLDTGQMWVAIGAIAALAVIIGGLAAALNKFSGGATLLESMQLNSVLLSLGASFLLLSVSAKILGTMDASAVQSALTMLAAFTAVITILIAMSTIGKGMDKVASFLKQVGTSFLLLSVTAKILGSMSPSEMDTAQSMLMTFAGVISILMAVTQIGGKDIKRASSFIKNVGATFLLLSVAAKIMGSMSPDEFNMAANCMVMFGLVIAGLMAATKLIGGGDIASIGNSILQIAGAIAILAVVAALIGGVDSAQLANGIGAIAVLGLIVVGLMSIVKLMGTGEMAKVGMTLLSMSLAIGILAGIAVLLGMVDPAGLAQGIVAVGFLAAFVVAMTKATAGASDVQGTMIGIAVAIGVMAASVALLSLLDPAKVAVATACMSALMGMFALVVKMGSNVQTSMGIMIVMVAAIAVMGGMIYLLAGLPVENVIGSAASLSLLLITLAGALKILSTIQTVSAGVIASVAILTLVMAGLGLILAMMTALGVENAIENAVALSLLAVTMTGVMVALSLIGPLATGAIGAAASMAAVIGIIAAVVAAAGAIAQIPGAQWLVSEGAAFLQSIGEAIGGFVGGIVGGFLEAATSTLPQVAMNLSLFGVGIQPFIMAMKQMDSSVLDSCTNLALAIAALTGASFLESIASFLTGESSLTKFAEELVPFGEGMAKFAATLSGVDLNALLIGSIAAKYVADLANALPKEGGALQFFTGETVDMGTFGNNLALFGSGLKMYGLAVTDLNSEGIMNSIEPARSLSDLAKDLPAEGGILDSIFGSTVSLDQFGAQLLAFGAGLVGYSLAVANLNTEAIQNSVPAAKSISDMAKELPQEGGILDSIFGGTTSLESFGNQLKSFGEAMSEYSVSVTDLNISAINSSTNAIRQFVSVIDYATDMDIAGINNAKKISDVGESLKTYSDKISSVDPAKVSASADAIKRLKDTINDLAGLDSSGIASFQSAIDSLANTNVQGLIDSFNNIDMSSIGLNLMNSLVSGLRSGATNVISTVTEISYSINDKFTNAVKSFDNIGKTMFERVAYGITVSKASVISAVSIAITSAASSIRSYYGTFYSAGSYLCQGMANGISANSYLVRARASAMASAAALAAKRALDERSPSKVFYKIGAYAGQGLVNALGDYEPISYKAGRSVAESAVDGVGRAITSISDVLNSDMDVQPTIRPVVDLTSVKDGVNKVDSLFNGSSFNLGIERAGSIGRIMNEIGQNGSNDDVVYAINRLRNKLDDISKPSYSIGGVTYSGDSEVAEAVEALVRAVRIEGRS